MRNIIFNRQDFGLMSAIGKRERKAFEKVFGCNHRIAQELLFNGGEETLSEVTSKLKDLAILAGSDGFKTLTLKGGGLVDYLGAGLDEITLYRSRATGNYYAGKLGDLIGRAL